MFVPNELENAQMYQLPLKSNALSKNFINIPLPKYLTVDERVQEEQLLK